MVYLKWKLDLRTLGPAIFLVKRALEMRIRFKKIIQIVYQLLTLPTE